MVNQDEIRAERIARQSQMERSIEYFQLMGITPTLEDLVLTSHVLTKFIMDGYGKELKEMCKGYDKYISDNYKGK